ncbi:MAG: hypothetical protein M1817_004204 [Caeruleum heppii]|nr:MAG: hypothetical protein M1817_004204 [Caeruleum heppii]
MRIETALTFGLALFAWATSLEGKGINCQGSSQCRLLNCPGFGGWNLGCIGNMAEAFFDPEFDVNRTWRNGEQIFCFEDVSTAGIGNLCAFLQNQPEGASGREIQEAIRKLRRHGCKRCGSVPMQEGNDVSKGQLTVNYVRRTKCKDHCDE